MRSRGTSFTSPLPISVEAFATSLEGTVQVAAGEAGGEEVVGQLRSRWHARLQGHHGLGVESAAGLPRGPPPGALFELASVAVGRAGDGGDALASVHLHLEVETEDGVPDCPLVLWGDDVGVLLAMPIIAGADHEATAVRSLAPGGVGQIVARRRGDLRCLYHLPFEGCGVRGLHARSPGGRGNFGKDRRGPRRDVDHDRLGPGLQRAPDGGGAVIVDVAVGGVDHEGGGLIGRLGEVGPDIGRGESDLDTSPRQHFDDLRGQSVEEGLSLLSTMTHALSSPGGSPAVSHERSLAPRTIDLRAAGVRCFITLDAAEVRVSQIGTDQARPAKISSLQRGGTEVRPVQVGAAQIRPLQRRVRERRPVEIAP